jgi:hypothetical protein
MVFLMRPELHPNEVLQAKLVIHDLATSGLGEKVSEMAGTLGTLGTLGTG